MYDFCFPIPAGQIITKYVDQILQHTTCCIQYRVDAQAAFWHTRCRLTQIAIYHPVKKLVVIRLMEPKKGS